MIDYKDFYLKLFIKYLFYISFEINDHRLINIIKKILFYIIEEILLQNNFK
jgi:hypothetical protein